MEFQRISQVEANISMNMKAPIQSIQSEFIRILRGWVRSKNSRGKITKAVNQTLREFSTGVAKFKSLAGIHQTLGQCLTNVWYYPGVGIFSLRAPGASCQSDKIKTRRPFDPDMLLNPDKKYHQQRRDVDSVLVYCWTNVADVGPTINKHWIDVLCLLGFI